MSKKRFTLLEVGIILVCASILAVLITVVVEKEITKDKKIEVSEYQKETTVGKITEFLLSNYETHSYMNGMYLKGDITDNYIWYNGFIWRIMGKNEDGSIRLITEENVTAIPWGKQNDSEGYKNSYVNDWINNYFLPKLKDQSSLVESKFCGDTEFYLNNPKRTTCSNSVLAKGGLLSRDEYNLSGEENSYLSNEIGSLTSTQYVTPNGGTGVWLAYSNPFIEETIGTSGSKGIRVIVSISPNTIVKGGNGTLTANQDTEYIISSKESISTLKDSGIGEYVTFDGRTYRVMEQENQTTKLILDGYYDTEVTYGKDFSDLKKVLESSEFENWLAPTRKGEILLTAWPRGITYEEGENYRESLNSKANGYTAKIGLSRIGDILSTQGLSLLTKNYSSEISCTNTKSYWLLNPKGENFAWYMEEYDYATFDGIDSSYTIRPIIVVSSNLKVQSGTGLLSNPYEI